MHMKLALLAALAALSLSARAQKDTTTLKKAVVTAVKPFLVQKADRIVINVDAMLTATGTNTLELLEQLSGVAVDVNGMIRFNGRAGVLVLIDDKPIYLSATDLANYLRGMPSALLSRIELISNPPARYDAASGAGLILIHTKKLREKGFNWQAAAGYGQSIYGRTNESASANWRRGKLNLFATVSYSWQHSYRRVELDREYTAPASFFNETSYHNPIRGTQTARIGMDYQFSPRSTLGFVVSGLYSTTNTHSPEQTVISDANHRLDSLTQADNSSRDHFNNQTANLNFTHNFRRPGELLTADADLVHRDALSRQLFLNTTVDPFGVPLSTNDEQARLPSSIHIYSGKIDYTLPLKSWRIESGAKASSVATDNQAGYFYLIGDSTVPDNDKTNHFLYTENIQAAYTSITREGRRLSVQGGLRLEHTGARGHQLGNSIKPDSGFNRHYTDLFPTVNLDYKLDTGGHHHLRIAYGRRINRPGYQDLNPFIFLVNQYMYIAGNPYLRPQYSDNLELSWRWAQLLTTTLFYNYTRDIEQELIRPSGEIFISQPGNIGHRTGLGLSVNLSLQPLKRWNLNLFSQLINSRYVGAIGDSSLFTNATAFSFNWNNQFAFTPDWAADLSGNYSGPATEAQFRSKATGMISAGISRKLLHRKATLRLAARDLFHTVRPAGTLTNIPGVIVHYRNFVDTQVVGLSFSYTFSSGKTARTRKTGSAEDEQGRIKE
jgi:hypothetical protein